MNAVAFLWWENEVKFDRDRPFSKKWKCDDYAEYTELLRERDVDVVCGEYRWYKDGRMEKAFRWNGSEWEKVEDVELDGVYDLFRHDKEKYELKQEMKEEVGILNDPDVADLCQDKLKTFERFPEFMPATEKASRENVEEMLDAFGKAILKPRYGSSGEGIRVIEDISEYDAEDPENVLVQEFVEDAKIPELDVEGPHDLRILVVNDEVVGSYLRIPGEDSVLSNVAQGGSKRYIELEDVPENVMNRVKEVAAQLSEFRPVIYTVDFMIAEEPYLVELNSQPGVYYHGPGRSEEWERPWMLKIVDAVEELAKDRNAEGVKKSSMKNFAVLWDELDQDGEKPASSEWRNEDIALYTYFARKHGLKLYHAHYSQFSEGKLGKAWFYNGKTWEKREDVEIRGVYDKFVMNENTKDLRREIEDQVLLINALELQEIAADKLKTYQNLKEHSKETRKASEENVRKMLDENRRVLIKPRYGSGGEGIEVIEDVSEYKPSQDVEELVQAFIEPGSLPEFGVEGPHDLRMFMINGEIRSCYIRLPDEGLLSNVNLGGRTEYVDVDEIPEKAVEKAKAIDRGLEHISPRIYSIDLMKGESGDFWLVELNDKPAVYCFKPACDMNVEFENIERMFEVMSKAMD